MKKLIYKVINKLGYRIENKQNQIDKEMSYLSKFNVTSNISLLFRSKVYIKKIEKHFPELKIENFNNGFVFYLADVKIYVESVEEIFIISEVFVEADYNFLSKSKTIVIDIGANIGISSLFFSKMDFVEKIYSFEPVPETFEQAKLNFSMNKSLSKIVEINNFGLGGFTRDETFIFNKNIKGNTGVRGLLSPSYSSNSNNSIEVKVQIKNVSEVISEIIARNSNMNIVVKMDCEGAEYEIFDNLIASGLINSISMFMIEWHDKGATTIENHLKSANFNYFSRNLDPISGMIYAYRAQ
jgi:FkbM family methyltransferase